MRLSGALVAACVLLLSIDAFIARWRAPGDDKRVKAMQQLVKADAAVAPRLEAEQKRITAARRARKLRDKIAAEVLIAAAIVFLVSAKRRVKDRSLTVAARSVSPARTLPSRDRQGAVAAPALDLSYVEILVDRHGRSREAAILLLQAIQTHYRYLPDEALRRLCELTEITPAEISGTSSFYGQFRRSPLGKHLVRVCHGTACHVSGARQVTEELRRYLTIPEGADTDAARMFTLEEVACLGCCSLAPVLMVDSHTAGRLTPATACDALEAVERKEPA
jgi:NADH:ubiquinone oxidoreductase subunit E